MPLMGKSTISMAIFKFANCKRLPGRVTLGHPTWLTEVGKHPTMRGEPIGRAVSRAL